MYPIRLLGGVATAIFSASMATASVVGVSGSVTQIATPGSVTNSAPGSNTSILVFDELQNYLLTSALATDGGGSIAAGTRVDSHMVFLNRASGSTQITLAGGVTFGGLVLGTMSDINGNLYLNPSDYLGFPTTYAHFNNRGLESNDFLGVSGNSVNVRLTVTQPGDWIRVVTVAAVPLPAGALLLPTGLMALGAMRRRKKAKKA